MYRYWNEIKDDEIWYFSFCFKGVHVNHLILVYSSDQISMKFCFMCYEEIVLNLYLVICIFLKYFSLNITQKGGQLEIFRSVRAVVKNVWL